MYQRFFFKARQVWDALGNLVRKRQSNKEKGVVSVVNESSKRRSSTEAYIKHKEEMMEIFDEDVYEKRIRKRDDWASRELARFHGLPDLSFIRSLNFDDSYNLLIDIVKRM